MITMEEFEWLGSTRSELNPENFAIDNCPPSGDVELAVRS